MGLREPQRWNELYEAAILELDPRKLIECVRAAEQAIRERLSALERERSAGTSDERQFMYDALQTLSNLRRIGARNDPRHPR
ncbi:MAG TPA: hypothetical protein VNF00_05810 [Candidatus Acidoferrales bacterium]|nr:hypothetical protein [Candidatus Acidoferrales bacterium]